jgi:hypothetical protein
MGPLSGTNLTFKGTLSHRHFFIVIISGYVRSRHGREWSTRSSVEFCVVFVLFDLITSVWPVINHVGNDVHVAPGFTISGYGWDPRSKPSRDSHVLRPWCEAMGVLFMEPRTYKPCCYSVYIRACFQAELGGYDQALRFVTWRTCWVPVWSRHFTHCAIIRPRNKTHQVCCYEFNENLFFLSKNRIFRPQGRPAGQ